MDANDNDAERREKLRERYPILAFFGYEHLRPDLREVSYHFFHLAWLMARNLPHNAETAVTLRKLLEAKDAAVRSAAARRLS